MNELNQTLKTIISELQKINYEMSAANIELSEIKYMLLEKWKTEDESYGEYRWPYDIDGELLNTVSLTIPEVNQD